MAAAVANPQFAARVTVGKPRAAKRSKTACTVIGEMASLEVPTWVVSLESFRQWVHSDAVPEKGVRICYLDGEVWIDMSKEQVFSHNQVKLEYDVVLGSMAKRDRLGRYFPDGILLTNRKAKLAAGPDGIFVSHSNLRAGRVRFIEGKKGGYVEMRGSPDMVLEIISDGSVLKDSERLLKLYWKAGVAEYWLVDVRGDNSVFEIYRHTAKGYIATSKQDGWLKSKVFGKSFRLTRDTDEDGNPEYSLAVK